MQTGEMIGDPGLSVHNAERETYQVLEWVNTQFQVGVRPMDGKVAAATSFPRLLRSFLDGGHEVEREESLE